MDNDPNNQQQNPYQYEQYPMQSDPAYQAGYQSAYAQPDTSLPTKMKVLIGFGVLLLVTTVAISLLGGQDNGQTTNDNSAQTASTALVEAETGELSFAISIPEDWSSIQENDGGIEALIAQPNSAVDESSILVTLDPLFESSEQFASVTEDYIQNDPTTSNTTDGVKISNFSSNSYGTDSEPAYEFNYTEQNNTFTYSVREYRIFQGDGTVVALTFKASENYIQLLDSATEIVSSYRTK